jgi:hypothetical protein
MPAKPTLAARQTAPASALANSPACLNIEVFSCDRGCFELETIPGSAASSSALENEISSISLSDFAGLIKSDLAHWGAVVQASGFTPQD